MHFLVEVRRCACSNWSTTAYLCIVFAVSVTHNVIFVPGSRMQNLYQGTGRFRQYWKQDIAIGLDAECVPM